MASTMGDYPQQLIDYSPPPPPQDQPAGQYAPYQNPYPPPSPSPVNYPQPNVGPSNYGQQYPQGNMQPAMYQPPPQAIVVIREDQVQPGYAVLQGDFNPGFSRQSATCPACRQMMITRVSRSPSAVAWISCMCLSLLLFIIIIPLCCIPFCIPSCYNVKHYCSLCDTFLGERKG